MHAGRCDLKPACGRGGREHRGRREGWVVSRRPWRGGSAQREDAGVEEETEQADEQDDTGPSSRRAHAPAWRATTSWGSLVALIRYRPGWNLSWLIVQTRQGGLVAPHRLLPSGVNARRPWRGGMRKPAFRITEEVSAGKFVSQLGLGCRVKARWPLVSVVLYPYQAFRRATSAWRWSERVATGRARDGRP